MANKRPRVILREFDVPVPACGTAGSGLRIAHLSDFHFRRWDPVLAEAQQIMRSVEYDLIVATGDFSVVPRRWEHAADMACRFFDPLRARLGIYGVLGNHDGPALAEHAHLPFRLLRDEHVSIDREGSIVLAGLEQTHGRLGDVTSTLDGISPRATVILLAHYPSTIHRIPVGQVQLQLSGHTHGGQIRLPWLGCLWCNDRIPVSMAQGLHRVGKTYLHVSAGLGVSPPLLARYRCPPEITLLTLRPTELGHATATGEQKIHKSRRRMGLPAKV